MDAGSPRRTLAPVAVLLLALGGPAAALAGLRRMVVTHPVAAVVGVLLYKVLLAAVVLATEVGRGLRTRWADRLADRIDASLQDRFSRYRRAYLDGLMKSCQPVAVPGGASLPFETVYDRLDGSSGIRAQPPWRHEPCPVTAGLQRCGHSKQNYLGCGCGRQGTLKAARLRRRGYGQDDAGKACRPCACPRCEAAAPVSRCLSASSPGAGSSISTFRPVPGRPRAPDNTDFPPCLRPPAWLEHKLRRQQCVVVVDGLTEVSEQDRPAVRQWLRRQFALYPDVPFLVTWGPFDGDELWQDFTVYYQIQPLTVKQVEELSRNWHEAAPDMPGENESEQSRFLACLRTVPGLWAFAGNPLLLQAVFGCFSESGRSGSRDPRHRDLLAAICTELLSRARCAFPDLTPDSCNEVLEYLAYCASYRHSLCIAASDAAQNIGESLARTACSVREADFLRVMARIGILQQAHAGEDMSSHAFTHPVLQDFFAARYLGRHPPSDSELRDLVRDAWWQQALCLASGVRQRTTCSCGVRRAAPPADRVPGLGS